MFADFMISINSDYNVVDDFQGFFSQLYKTLSHKNDGLVSYNLIITFIEI